MMNDEIEIPILSTSADIYLAGMELFSECKIIIELKKILSKLLNPNRRMYYYTPD